MTMVRIFHSSKPRGLNRQKNDISRMLLFVDAEGVQASQDNRGFVGQTICSLDE
jgi:hypothetical protein